MNRMTSALLRAVTRVILSQRLGANSAAGNNDRGDGIGCSQGAGQLQGSTRQKKRMPLG